jgi:hypothetical protein
VVLGREADKATCNRRIATHTLPVGSTTSLRRSGDDRGGRAISGGRLEVQDLGAKHQGSPSQFRSSMGPETSKAQTHSSWHCVVARRNVRIDCTRGRSTAPCLCSLWVPRMSSGYFDQDFRESAVRHETGCREPISRSRRSIPAGSPPPRPRYCDRVMTASPQLALAGSERSLAPVVGGAPPRTEHPRCTQLQSAIGRTATVP